MTPEQQRQEAQWATDRHRCLIRHLLALRAKHGLEWFREEARQWKQWPALQNDFVQQWQRGNRGAAGDWRE